MPAPAVDAFGLLGLAPRFDVDAAQLERAFFERSKELHPDRFATRPVAERVAALSKSRALNDAYQLLKREVTRAEYLLAHEGLTIGDNERIDPALVMELLEEREVLAEARAKGDLPRIEQLCESMRARRRAALDQVKTLFGAAEALTDEPRKAQLADIKRQLILLRYVERYLEECDAALDEE
ncbi:MAG: Fe-S protein assembly co-chaperone HscB [Deltaproteobacteria bacterium]|nr:Fe-S protein assembly co-chaperone HscB [Deltaproteobacteria bacterium]MDQ3300808.1 Fe-S protein assembly co-chaperone HscB [Myxococcota bacterium]